MMANGLCLSDLVWRLLRVSTMVRIRPLTDVAKGRRHGEILKESINLASSKRLDSSNKAEALHRITSTYTHTLS